jgi:hypothetical protein
VSGPRVRGAGRRRPRPPRCCDPRSGRTQLRHVAARHAVPVEAVLVADGEYGLVQASQLLHVVGRDGGKGQHRRPDVARRAAAADHLAAAAAAAVAHQGGSSSGPVAAGLCRRRRAAAAGLLRSGERSSGSGRSVCPPLFRRDARGHRPATNVVYAARAGAPEGGDHMRARRRGRPMGRLQDPSFSCGALLSPLAPSPCAAADRAHKRTESGGTCKVRPRSARPCPCSDRTRASPEQRGKRPRAAGASRPPIAAAARAYDHHLRERRRAPRTPRL